MVQGREAGRGLECPPPPRIGVPGEVQMCPGPGQVSPGGRMRVLPSAPPPVRHPGRDAECLGRAPLCPGFPLGKGEFFYYYYWLIGLFLFVQPQRSRPPLCSPLAPRMSCCLRAARPELVLLKWCVCAVPAGALPGAGRLRELGAAVCGVALRGGGEGTPGAARLLRSEFKLHLPGHGVGRWLANRPPPWGNCATELNP